MERFQFPLGKVAKFQNALIMFLNAFQRFEMRCAEKRLNANFVKPVFPKAGHKLRLKSCVYFFTLICFILN